MDIISHGLWGSIVFGRQNKKSFWLSFLFGILPDFLVFAPFTLSIFLGLLPYDMHFGEPPDVTGIPSYVYGMYDITHSLVIFAAVFLLVAALKKRPMWELGAWGLHILIDIPTHSSKFFPTPFLWPLSDAHINGHSWGDPRIFIPNVLTLALLYLYFFVLRPRLWKNGGERYTK